MFVQAICFADLSFEAVARYGGFEMTFGYGNDDFDRRYLFIRMSRSGVLQPDHPQRIGHIRMAVLKKAADQRPAFQPFGSGEGMDWSVHKGGIECSTIQK